jgi:hypothetical protein
LPKKIQISSLSLYSPRRSTPPQLTITLWLSYRSCQTT